MKCSKCNGTNLSAQKAGFGLGKAAAGAILTGGVGLMAGFLGSNKMVVHCLDCGHKWNPVELAKKEERERTARSIVAMDEEIAALKKEEKEALKKNPKRNASSVAVNFEAAMLTSQIVFEFDLSMDDLKELEGFNKAHELEDYNEADLRYLQAFKARLLERAAARKKKEVEAIKEEPERDARSMEAIEEEIEALKKEMEAIKEEPERNASPVAVTLEVWVEAQKLIGDMFGKFDLSMDDLNKIEGYNTALGKEEFSEADWRNLQAFNARLSERAAKLKK